MIDIRLNSRRAIMRVSLIDRIQAQDFSEAVAPAAERLRARHGRIEFLILDVRRFHGWGAGGTFAAQIRFLRCFGRSVERVAVFGSRAWQRRDARDRGAVRGGGGAQFRAGTGLADAALDARAQAARLSGPQPFASASPSQPSIWP